MYITTEQLKGFDSYKYSCKDTSPLANYVMHPFWNRFVKVFPMWLAPNLMTFGGFLILAFQYVLLAFYDPNYDAASSPDVIPMWVWWFSAAAQFASHTLDGCDGKQARRTGTSTPLGELFDHGIDSWCVSLFTLNVFSVFGKRSVSVEELYAIQVATLIAFVASHWEKYNTGVLYLPWAYDLSQVILTFVYFTCALLGPEFWLGGVMGFSYAFIFKCTAYGGVVVAIGTSLYNIYVASRSGTGKQLGVVEGGVPLLSPVLLFAVLFTWAVTSPGHVLHTHPRALMFLTSVVFSNILARLIVAQMSSTRCQPLNGMVIASALVYALVWCLPEWEFPALATLIVVATVAHIHYGVVVVRDLARHLGIEVFSIRKKD